jgi:tetratricopeptide (TPR) repeat protein
MAQSPHPLTGGSVLSRRAAAAPARFAVLTLAIALGGCPNPAPRPDLAVTAPLPPTPAVPQPGQPNPSEPPRPPAVAPPVRENHLSAATLSLVTQSRRLASRGDLDGASSTLDRALRIEPNNPLVWIELGRLRLAASDPHQAESCGRKALALASGDRAAQRQAGRLLIDALRAQQRNPEAHAVESQPFMR